MRSLTRPLILIAIAVLALGSIPSHAASHTVRFGVQSWPAVNVKTDIAASLLRAMGYEPDIVTLGGTVIIVKGLSTGSLDVAFGAWYPVAAAAIDPAVKSGTVVKLTKNVSGAISGIAVPTYVYKQGVTSLADLNKHADQFGHKIYGIEPGATWNTGVIELIKNDKYNLGNWTLVPSSTAAMLSQVGQAVSEHKWIVFYGWKPHWMNIKYKISYLRTPGVHNAAATVKTSIYTLVRSGFLNDKPNLKRFFMQFKVPVKVQSQWIYDITFKSHSNRVVGEDWIKNNGALIKKWLNGVTTADGKPAYAAVASRLGIH